MSVTAHVIQPYGAAVQLLDLPVPSAASFSEGIDAAMDTVLAALPAKHRLCVHCGKQRPTYDYTNVTVNSNDADNITLIVLAFFCRGQITCQATAMARSREVQELMRTEKAGNQICSFCQDNTKTGTIECAECHTVRYCSEDCQTKHWKDHASFCRAALKAKTLVPCCVCQTPLQLPKRCSRCKKRVYCKIECQRMDWPAHKEQCCKEEETPVPSQSSLNPPQ
jgi:hypothetical protein